VGALAVSVPAASPLRVVCCADDPRELRARLLASECLASRRLEVFVHVGASSAAEGFNASIARAGSSGWLVWAHQDVFLPPGWDARFLAALADAAAHVPNLAVAGVYGVRGAGDAAVRAGHVLDRGILLREPEPLPCAADSLDELLFAVRCDSGLALDPQLGFDFHATDLALTARERGFGVAVVDAPCEHWSTLPREGVSPRTVERIRRSGERFERKWAHRLPVTTPCVHLARAGAIAELAARSLAAAGGAGGAGGAVAADAAGARR
jgi:hypothetical protein